MSLMIQIQTCQVNIGNPKAQSSNIRVVLYVRITYPTAIYGNVGIQ